MKKKHMLMIGIGLVVGALVGNVLFLFLAFAGTIYLIARKKDPKVDEKIKSIFDDIDEGKA